jgi:putative hemolysin
MLLYLPAMLGKNMNKIIIVSVFLIGIVVMGFLLVSWHTVYAPTVSHSNPTPTTTLANPASVNCSKVGGTLLIKKLPNGNEYGLCDFGDNMQCEEWALFRGDCPVGGVKTTGFDSIDQKYCAWLGGKTFAVKNATCTLPNGKICDDSKLYNGTCN